MFRQYLRRSGGKCIRYYEGITSRKRALSSLLHENRSKVAKLKVLETSRDDDVVDVIFCEEAPDCTEFLGHKIPKSQVEHFKGNVKETLVLHNKDDKVRVYVGIGDENKTRSEENARTAAYCAIKELEKLKTKEANLHLPEFCHGDASFVRAIAQSSVLSTYKFDRYKTRDADEDSSSSSLENLNLIVSSTPSVISSVNEQIALNEGTILARDLGNERGDVAHPDALEETCHDLCSEYNFNFKVRSGKMTCF